MKIRDEEKIRDIQPERHLNPESKGGLNWKWLSGLSAGEKDLTQPDIYPFTTVIHE